MTNRGAISQSLNCGGSYTIPSGYHNGNGKVTANSLSSQTSADAVAANILKDKTAWVNGSKITGTMANNGAVAPAALGAGGSYTIPAGYHNGSGKVTAQSLATITSGGTVTAASQILSGYKAYSDGTLYTGSMTNQGAQTKTFTPSTSSQSYTIPAGYHNGSGKVTCNAIPSGYVDLSAGANFFKDGAFGTLKTYLGQGGVEPLGDGEFFNYLGSDAYGSSIDANGYWVNTRSETYPTYFGTLKTMDFTNISTITLVIKCNRDSRYTTINLWAYGANTKTLKTSYTSTGPALNTFKTYTFDVSDLNEQCGFGFYVKSNSSYATTWYISELSLS